MKILTIRSFTIVFFYFFINLSLHGQGINSPMGNEQTSAILDRLEVLYGNNTYFHTATKPTLRSDVVKYAFYLDSSNSVELTKRDKEDLRYLFNDNNDFLKQVELPKTIGEKNKTAEILDQLPPQYQTRRKPIFKYFYKTPANFWEHDSKYFKVRLNPVLNLDFGRDVASDENSSINRRGVDLRFVVDNRVYFQTQILTTILNPINYLDAWIEKYKAVPGAGFYKNYFNYSKNRQEGVAYYLAQGMIGFNFTPHIGLQLGHGQHFIGDGMRSLILSNFANNYLYLRLNTKVWHFHYQNIIAELSSENHYPGRGDRLIPKKYLALHHLSYNLLPNLNFGVSEMVIMNRSQQFDLQYLNPIIFYRGIEGSIGSPDNVLIGFNSKWNVRKGVSIYGQFLLDEFYFKELFVEKRGWWANKFGTQIGAKYFNAFGVDHLDLQVEYNKVRPFTYSHYDSIRNYTHSFQPLAHPFGANFKEFLFKLRYQPHVNWLIESRIMRADIGENGGLGVLGNWGNEPLAPNRDGNRANNQEDGFFTGIGVKAKVLSIGFDVSYQFLHNAYADLRFLYRSKASDDSKRNQETLFLGGGIRLNIGKMRTDF